MISGSLEKSWNKAIRGEFDKDYIHSLDEFLKAEVQNGKLIYPQPSEIFNAFKLTPFDKVNVVIIGQDPYHGEGQAHGLCFSVNKGVKVPPSLKNIYKEMKSDLGITPAEHGNLESWARQGVLLLNNVLTVEKSSPGSHRKKGWEIFTDRVIEVLDHEKENLVFILWGRDAQTKAAKVNRDKHLVLESAHPSPFSVTKFLGNRHFSKTNDYLRKHSKRPINWELEN